jgi:hypothetical protein
MEKKVAEGVYSKIGHILNKKTLVYEIITVIKILIMTQKWVL